MGGGTIAADMLVELHIAGLGVIDDATLELAPGLNVLTGETGAGKTMVTVGLSLALGARARGGMVREGSERAGVEARFDVRAAPSAAEWADDGELVLARSVSAEGRSSSRAGGQLAQLTTLSELGADLVEVHGQHQTQRLLSPAAQLGFLDRFCGAEHVELLGRYRAAFRRLREVRERLAGLDRAAREREREKDLLEYQVREIEAAGVRPGERDELEAEERRLGHAERILELVAGARASLGEDGGGADALDAAAAALEEVTGLDPGAADLSARVAALAVEARDAAGAIRAYAEGLELDPSRLQEVRERLAALRDLERKYGDGEEGIIAYLEEARGRLAAALGTDEERAELSAEAARLEAEVSEMASGLRERRTAAAPDLAERLRAELEELGMAGARIEVDLRPQDPGPDGTEAAELRFAGGPGQAPQPLRKVASGGELSRTMLACRTILADLDEVPTLVFDEVDAGIGGRAGVAVGRRLARLAVSRQVLVVTHLPQIACFADRHFHVAKEGGRTTVRALEGEDRVAELSRMLSGMPTEEAATHAEQLLAEAAREKAG